MTSGTILAAVNAALAFERLLVLAVAHVCRFSRVAGIAEAVVDTARARRDRKCMVTMEGYLKEKWMEGSEKNVGVAAVFCRLLYLEGAFDSVLERL